jgi:hypothetical protein
MLATVISAGFEGYTIALRRPRSIALTAPKRTRFARAADRGFLS